MLRQLIIVFCVLTQIFLVFMVSACINQAGVRNLENAEENKKLNVAINKLIYEHGEPVELTVSLGDISAADEVYLKLGECRCEIKRDNYKDIFLYGDQTNSPITDECEKYSAIFHFMLNKFQTQTIIWDQKSCELKNYPSQAVPGDYQVSVYCTARSGGIRDSAYFIINESQSCKDKRVKVMEANWDSSNNIHVKIKNTGNLDVEAVQVLLDICHLDFIAGGVYYGPKEVLILGGINVGETKEYTIPPEQSKCYYRVVSASVYECHDGNPDDWSEIKQP